jgi:hypothetical protein
MNNYNKKFAAILLSFLLIAPSVKALARDDRGRSDRGRGGSREEVFVGHDRYHYRDGRFYRPGWFGFEFLLGAPPLGVIVSSIPVDRRTIFVGGTTYYNYNDIYYVQNPGGYMVVAPPVVSAPVMAAPPVILTPTPQESLTINIPNSNGSFTPVIVTRKGSGYVGPQGEYYPEHPSVEQLKALYGK